MREIERNIARNNMKKAGIEKINKKSVSRGLDGRPIKESKFSRTWRKYVY